MMNDGNIFSYRSGLKTIPQSTVALNNAYLCLAWQLIYKESKTLKYPSFWQKYALILGRAAHSDALNQLFAELVNTQIPGRIPCHHFGTKMGLT